ncbi:unnamed protein product [Haemonchus placei]|uniref:Piezo_RRas_bdg domain-containing protein n=1 Tax=Haemonchus placei TaxID=6290 RepID=A0A0N4WCJ2_HAEPC|nr:unnamed protein product [Haemonchus placei]
MARLIAFLIFSSNFGLITYRDTFLHLRRITVLSAAFIRPCFISIVYVIFALISPLLPSIHAALPLPVFYLYKFRFHNGDGFESAKSILPEIVAVLASAATAVMVSLFSHRTQNLEVVGPVRPVRMPNEGSGPSSIVMALKRFSNFAIIFLSALVGCVQPSLLNCTYFAAFLFVASWWALYKPLRHQAYNRIKKFLLFFAALHILMIYVYQIPIVQKSLPGKSIIARLVVFYHVLMLQLLWTYDGSRSYVDDNDGSSSVHEEVSSTVSPSKYVPSLSLLTFSLLTTSLPRPLPHAVSVWALLYHSIFGLILLVISCILWMFKDSRKASFAMAPTLTIYVEFLLLTQYACSMNVTAKELQLPDWMKMIGFVIAENMLAGFVTLSVKVSIIVLQ